MGTFVYVLGVIFVVALMCVLAFGLWDLGMVIKTILEIRADEHEHDHKNNTK